MTLTRSPLSPKPGRLVDPELSVDISGHDVAESGSTRTPLFRWGVLAVLTGVFLTIRLLKTLVWPETGHLPEGLWDQLVRWGALGWCMLLPWAIADVVGWLIYRSPTSTGTGSEPVERMAHRVVFRVVTRGDQPDVAATTVDNIDQTMEIVPLFPYTVEVVTDIPIAALPPSTRQIVVPDDYETPRGATHKARALDYASKTSPIDDDDWILHLDEESHITPELVVGIRNAVVEEEASGDHRIGQGLILYHRDLESNPVLTLADSIRVGDDLGRFHLQYRLNRVMFGMHGSFVLVRNSVEKEVGFDFSPQGSVTEDTTWGLTQMDRGQRFRWVDGHVVEQSPRRVIDFLKQRRRWFSGMWWAALKAPVSWVHRAPLAVTMLLWSLAWFNLLYTWVHLFSGVALPTTVALLGDFIFTVYVANYVIGLWVSLGTEQSFGFLRKIRWMGLQVVLLPIHAVIEAAAVGYAFFRPERGFHVIAK